MVVKNDQATRLFIFNSMQVEEWCLNLFNFVLVAKSITEDEVWAQDHKLQELEHLNKFSREAWMVKPGW